jgi:hypothetical protein
MFRVKVGKNLKFTGQAALLWSRPVFNFIQPNLFSKLSGQGKKSEEETTLGNTKYSGHTHFCPS